MKKSHIIFVLIILLSLSLVDARDIFWIDDPKCLEGGAITFKVDNTYENEVATKKIEVWVRYLGFSNEKSYKINGNWSSFFVYTKTENKRSPVTFISPRASLNYSGDYEINLIYTNDTICGQEHRNCNITSSITNCVGNEEYDCSVSNIKIESCYNVRDYVYLNFSGLNRDQYKKLTEKNFIYDIDGQKRAETKIRLPEDAKIRKIEEDNYLFKMNLERWGNIKSIAVYVDECINLVKKAEISCMIKEEKCNSCEVLKDGKCELKCKSDDICKIVGCKDGTCLYQIKENCCKEKKDCDDFLACTEDSCANNKCTHTNIKCTASDDPCVVGVCEEPSGCKYISKPDCETMEDVTGKAVSKIEKEEKQSFFKILVNWVRSIFVKK